MTDASKTTRLCGDCPPVGYPTDSTRCAECPRRAPTELAIAASPAADGADMNAQAWAALPDASYTRTMEEIAEAYIAWCKKWAPALAREPSA